MEFGKRFVFLVFSIMFAFSLSQNNEVDVFSYLDKIVLKEEKVSTNYVETAREKYNNQDIIARLFIESINLDVPVLKYSDNDFYLNHDEYKNKNKLGAIFLDYRNNIDLDRKLLIFGHNSKTIKTEFKKIETFLSNDFYNEESNRKLILETSNKIATYEVTTVFIVDKDFQHMDLSFTQDEWKNHIEWINSSSMYKDNLLTDTDEIIIMQTCYYEPSDSYLLVVAKKIEEEYY